MTSPTFAVMGATGQVGQALAEALLQDGCRVRAIGRDAKKLAALKARGADPCRSSFDDVVGLCAAFSGCDGVFAMIPPDYRVEDPGAFQDRVGEHICAALARARVGKVLNLSSLGAQQAEHTGPVKGLHRQELRLNSLPDADVLHLRPGYFMQNFLWSMSAIREHGVVASAVKPDLPISMVSTRDIGQKAAQLLQPLAFTGKSVFEFVGPRALTQQQAVAQLGLALGKPQLRYVCLSYADLRQALQASGMTAGAAALITEMQQGFNDGFFAATQPLGPEHQGRTDFAAFAREFAAAFAAQTIVAA